MNECILRGVHASLAASSESVCLRVFSRSDIATTTYVSSFVRSFVVKTTLLHSLLRNANDIDIDIDDDDDACDE